MLACKHTTLALEYALRSVSRDRPPQSFHNPSLGRACVLFRPRKSLPISHVDRATALMSPHSMETDSHGHNSNSGVTQNLEPKSPSVAADFVQASAKEAACLEDISHEWDSRKVPITGHSYEEENQVPVSEVFQQTELEAYSASIKVDAPFLRFLIGKGGKTKQRIEKETTTKIYVPSLRKVKHGSCVGIKGPSQEKVDEAVSRIQTLLHEAEESSSLEYSHFISLPLAFHPVFREQVMKFHDSVLSLKAGNDKQESVEYSELCKKMITTNSETETDISVTDASENFIAFKKVRGLETISITDVGKEGEEKFIISNTEETPMMNEEDNPPAKQEEIECVLLRSTKVYLNDLLERGEIHELDRHKLDDGIDESIFIQPARLHLTVLMLKLWNAERVATAVEVLQSLQSPLLEMLDHRPLGVRLRGLADAQIYGSLFTKSLYGMESFMEIDLSKIKMPGQFKECMKGSIEKAHVLYANVEENGEKNRLIQACNMMRDAFADAGLVSKKEQNHELKLHATMINTLHRKRKKGRRFGKRIPINAREILLKHGSDDWGEHFIVEAHLSQRFACGEDDYYRCCSAIQFPQEPVVTCL